MTQPLDGPTAEPEEAPAASGPTAKRRRLVRAISFLGIAIALLAVFLLVRTLVKQWPTISDALQDANIPLLVLAFLLSGAGIFGLAVLWRQCLAVFGDPRPMPRVAAWFFAGELGKYLPGGVWPVVGRGELATRGGVSRSVSYAATLVSLGVMCIGAALACGIVAPIVALESGRVSLIMLVLLVVPAGIVVVHPKVFGFGLRLGNRLTRGRINLEPPRWRKMLGLVLVSLPAWIGVGSASVVITAALHLEQQPFRVFFATVAAFLVGLLALPVPAGAGIRELIFVAVCGLVSGPATAVAAVARVMLIVVDGLGGLIGLLSLRSRAATSARAYSQKE